MQLPKGNERKLQSKAQQNALKKKLIQTVKEFQDQNNYEFLAYEVDNIFLEIIKEHHESYLDAKFGYDTV